MCQIIFILRYIFFYISTHLQVALQKVVDDEELIEDLKISEYFSVVLDESTDRSTEKTLMIYVRYLKKQL